MKKSIIATAIALMFSMGAKAQWERPDDGQGNQKKETQAKMPAQKKTIDPKYGIGTVPEVDGKVCWTCDVAMPGIKANDVYEKAVKVLGDFVKTEKHTKLSQIAVVNPQERKIGVRGQEMLVFSSKAFALDQTKFNYHLIVECTDGHCIIKLTNITYKYEEQRDGGVLYLAEEMINDANAINKKQTGFTKGGSKKFRTKTIDRKDEIFETLSKELTKQ